MIRKLEKLNHNFNLFLQGLLPDDKWKTIKFPVASDKVEEICISGDDNFFLQWLYLQVCASKFKHPTYTTYDFDYRVHKSKNILFLAFLLLVQSCGIHWVLGQQTL